MDRLYRFTLVIMIMAVGMAGSTGAAAQTSSYQEEEVVINSPFDGITLSGTISVPAGPGPFPAAYLIPGGSPFDRDMTLGDHRPFAVWANELALRGFVVLRVDDRGMGQSGGTKLTTNFEVLVADIAAGIEVLRGHGKVDAGRIGVLGHSQGAILAPKVASKSTDLAFVVMLAGTGMTFADNLAFQQAEEGTGTIETNLRLTKKLTTMLLGGDGASVTAEMVAQTWQDMVAHLPEERRPEAEAFIEGMSPPLTMFLSMPMFRDLLAFDPAPAIAATDCPLLALAGGQDPMQINLPLIAEAAQTRGNIEYVVVRLPNLNHMFQTTNEPDDGNPAAWVANEEIVSPRVLDFVGNWLERVCGAVSGP
jgi:pimeloyl-ACP methyl ester carboxylesterase